MSSICGSILRNTVRTTCSNNRFQLINHYRCAWLSTDVKKEGDPKKKVSPRITLISADNQLQIVTLEEAQKISKRRDLKLVKIVDLDTKTQRAVFRLMTGSEFHEEELKRREEKKKARNDPHVKGEKLLTLTSKISEHDLNSKLTKVQTWLRKFYEVRVVLNAGDHETQKAEKIVSTLESGILALGKINQKRIKDGHIRFSILPNLTRDQSETDNSTTTKQTNPETPSKQQVRSYHTMTVL